MDNRKQGEELNQLSRFIFDEAAHNFYISLLIECSTSIIATAISFFTLSEQCRLFFALIAFVSMCYAYFLRLKFEEQYDRAETMRRQSVLTEGLDWPLSKVQFSEWRRRAGRWILNRFKIEKRDPDYYETKKPSGARKLLEMTIESAFYTRYLYAKLHSFAWVFVIISTLITITVLTLLPFDLFNTVTRLRIAYIIYLLLPVLLTVDLLGWALRLGRLKNSIIEIERDMEKLSEKKRLAAPEVMRLISEYNCQVACGLPIANWMFKLWHKEIQETWKNR